MIEEYAERLTEDESRKLAEALKSISPVIVATTKAEETTEE